MRREYRRGKEDKKNNIASPGDSHSFSHFVSIIYEEVLKGYFSDAELRADIILMSFSSRTKPFLPLHNFENVDRRQVLLAFKSTFKSLTLNAKPFKKGHLDNASFKMRTVSFNSFRGNLG